MPNHPQSTRSFWMHARFFAVLVLLVGGIAIGWNIMSPSQCEIAITQLQKDLQITRYELEKYTKEYARISLEWTNLQKEYSNLQKEYSELRVEQEKIRSLISKIISENKVSISSNPFPSSEKTDIPITPKAKITWEQQKEVISWEIQTEPDDLPVWSTIKQDENILALNVPGTQGHCKLADGTTRINAIIYIRDTQNNRHQVLETWQPKTWEVLPVEVVVKQKPPILQNIVILDDTIPNIRLAGVLEVRKGHVADVWAIQNRTKRPLRITYHPSDNFRMSYRTNKIGDFVFWSDENNNVESPYMEVQIQHFSTSATPDGHYQMIVSTQSIPTNMAIFHSSKP